jgi:hypothetical protein
VGLINLREVVSHHTDRILGSTSHVLQFCSGGHVHFAYNDRCELLMLEGLVCGIRLDDDGHVLVGAHVEPAA